MSASTTGSSRCAAAISGCDAVAAADLHRHHGAEFEAAECSSMHLDGAGDVAAVGQPLLADQRRAHVGDDGDPIVVGQIQRRHQLHAIALA